MGNLTPQAHLTSLEAPRDLSECGPGPLQAPEARRQDLHYQMLVWTGGRSKNRPTATPLSSPVVPSSLSAVALIGVLSLSSKCVLDNLLSHSFHETRGSA
ncbi:hypothetical protein BHE90_011371 [Fusarium euwallaceae]|uniref:Uncharacterized protein n=2 Tax=Fusarium solani species complex TaxID=232080 RepID=A0A3M2RTP9_9HYPO|nr:hypothetical protein CDV36_011760 [Fusarium kuroshium]RTE74189.1 hypothetical protein BHE90_011371 [Fusarium euwallaceae]